MSDLVSLTISAHGGMDRWRQLRTVAAHLRVGGALWGLKGKEGLVGDVDFEADLHRERASFRPFQAPDRRAAFTPDRVALETTAGAVLEERRDPRASFAGHTQDTPWDHLQAAYFAGYAMWTYLTVPFLLAYPGVETEEMGTWQEAGQTWRRLKVRFPAGIATHSTEQVFYFDDRGLLQRHDYDVEVSGGAPGAHYVSGYEACSGVMIPTQRRVFPRQPDGTPLPEPLLVSIDLSHVVFS